MWLKLWADCAAEQDKEMQAQVALRLAGICHLEMPRKEGDREDFNQNSTVYNAVTGSFPTLYARRTLDEVFTVTASTYPRILAHVGRLLSHLENRITYERAMLAETGGTAADKTTEGRWLRFLGFTARRLVLHPEGEQGFCDRAGQLGQCWRELHAYDSVRQAGRDDRRQTCRLS